MRSNLGANSNATRYIYTNSATWTHTNSYGYSYTRANSDAHGDADNTHTYTCTYTHLHANTVAPNFRPWRGRDYSALCERGHALRRQLRTFFYQQHGSSCGDALPEHGSWAALDAS